MSRGSNGMARLRLAALVAAVAVAPLMSCGCWRGAKQAGPGGSPPSAPAAQADRPGAAPAAPAPADAGAPGLAGPGPGVEAVGPSAVPPAAPEAPPGEADRREESIAGPGQAPGPVGREVSPAAPTAVGGATAAAPQGQGDKEESVESGPKPRRDGSEAAARSEAARSPDGPPGRVIVARLPEHLSFDAAGPSWARGREELVYRVEFLGITMGYARFVFNGKVLLDGREVYHLSVRAWTSNVLALIYPVNDTIDYYMDIKTLEPLRQEYTSGSRKKDDVAIYDQGTGKIVYRYKESGEIRKQVDAVPNVYDPVTLAYLFRSREPGGDEKGRNVYAGRKVWEISATFLGVEKIATERGEVETVVIRPVIRRDGKLQDKGDLKMWMTRDERRIPVRIYAKFKKIRTWTLVGEIMPERKGG